MLYSTLEKFCVRIGTLLFSIAYKKKGEFLFKLNTEQLLEVCFAFISWWRFLVGHQLAYVNVSCALVKHLCPISQ